MKKQKTAAVFLCAISSHDPAILNKVSILRGLSVLIFFLGGLAVKAQPQPPSASGFVGSNVCRTCHPDIWANFYKNPHYKSVASLYDPSIRQYLRELTC